MQNLILVVDDNPDLLKNISMTLEFNGYKVITAFNGQQGLGLLNEMQTAPDLIISDIMMPEMDGFEFFKAVSQVPRWNLIPFFFLTASADPTHQSLGRLLGADDYIQKPFQEEELLQAIKGKIERTQGVRSRIERLAKTWEAAMRPSLTQKEAQKIVVFVMRWDPKEGPILEHSHPAQDQVDFQINEIGRQLFVSMASLYGKESIANPEGLLLRMNNIEQMGYIYFDALPEDKEGEIRFMVAVIAPRINYFESLQLRASIMEVAEGIKTQETRDIAVTWNDVVSILSEK